MRRRAGTDFSALSPSGERCETWVCAAGPSRSGEGEAPLQLRLVSKLTSLRILSPEGERAWEQRLHMTDKPTLDQWAAAADKEVQRSEERRVGKECVRTCRSRWGPNH